VHALGPGSALPLLSGAVVTSGPWKDEAEKAAWVEAERAKHLASIVLCEHCGTECVYTYSGVIGPWSKDDGKHLTELSDSLTRYGTRHCGADHTLERCFARVKAERDALRAPSEERPPVQVVVVDYGPDDSDILGVFSDPSKAEIFVRIYRLEHPDTDVTVIPYKLDTPFKVPA
jgi:hypothetical protein